MKYSRTKILFYTSTIFLFILPQDLTSQDKLEKLIAKGNLQKAGEYCLKQDGMTQKVCFSTLGDAYFADREYEKAAYCYEKSEHKSGFEKLGDQCFENRKYEKSALYYEKAYSGNNVLMQESYEKIAEAYYTARDYDKHISYFEKANSGNAGKLEEKYVEVGDIYFDDEEYGKAGKLYDKGNYKKGLESVGDIYFKRNDIDEAALYFDKAEKLYEEANTGDKPGELYFYSIWTDESTGQAFKVVTIGEQVWMAENLKTGTYSDGTPIPSSENDDEWDIERGSYCWYNFDSSRYEVPYGKLYNWYAVNTGKLCPVGWQVPSLMEWETLEDYLKENRVDDDEDREDDRIGGMLKEAGTEHWKDPNTGATNESGFTALPGGNRIPLGSSGNTRSKESSGWWWTSTEGELNEYSGSPQAFSLTLSHKSTQYWLRDIPVKYGCNVRCIKD